MSPKIQQLLAGYPVVVQMPIPWGDMDAYQHVNNVVYFRYFENARLEYFKRLDWFAFEEETGIGPILAATQARYRRPLEYPDNIWIGAKLQEMTDDQIILHHRIASETLDDYATEGAGTVMAFHYGEGKRVAIPNELKRRIEELEGKGVRELRNATTE